MRGDEEITEDKDATSHRRGHQNGTGRFDECATVIPAAYEGANRLAELLTKVIHVGNELAKAQSVLELCRRAVSAGLTQLGFDRMSIWLIEREGKTIRGTYGTDENGQIRDETSQEHEWSNYMPEITLLTKPHDVLRWSNRALYNDAREQVGVGDIGAAALWNGEDVIGLMYIDNCITRKPISEDQWHVFEAYASTLGPILTLKQTESDLRAQEGLLSQILDIMPVGVFVLSPEETIARYNRAAFDIWEFDPETLENWSPEAVWVKDRTPVGKDEWAGRNALRSGKSILNQEVEITHADGKRLVLLNSGVPLRDASGAVNGAVIVNQDITESKRREQQLAAIAYLGQVLRPLTSRRDIITTIVNHVLPLVLGQGAAILMAGEDGHIVYEAAAGDYSELTGMVVPQELGSRRSKSDVSIRIFDSIDSNPLCHYHTLKRNPRYLVSAPLVTETSAIGALVLGFDEKPYEETISLIRALADVAASAIQRGLLYDDLTTQARRLDRVMESVDFGLILLDPERRIVLANQHAQTRLTELANVVVGEELKEVAGQKLGRFVIPHSPAHTQEVNVDGSIYEITVVPVGASGEEGGWLMVVHDVTRERAIQASIQQHERLAAVGQLAAGIAHDFNNIIAVIMLYVQMLQRNPLLQEADQSRLNVIRDQAQNASKLIRQILDFSRQTLIEREPVDLQILLKDTVSLWERTLPESIALSLQAEFDGEALVLAEASSLQQALINLAINARDAMPDGGQLQVFLRQFVINDQDVPLVSGLKKGHWFAIYVSDTGTGISPEVLPHIFDPFFTTKEVGKGTGLGLAQVYGIVQQHGGLVTAQSEEGKGTTICLFLPALKIDEVQHLDGESDDAASDGNETILLVEDNAPAREATTALLEMLGYHVLVAADGRAALDLFYRHLDSIQLVLTDMIMPEMGGLELYQEIYRNNPSIALLVMTGYTMQDELRRLQNAGIVDWLQKPFTVKQLTVAVRRVLARRRQVLEASAGENA